INNYSMLQILAVDDNNMVLCCHLLNSQFKNVVRDVTLSPGLDPQKHFAAMRSIKCLQSGEIYNIDNLNNAKYTSFEKLFNIFDLYSGLATTTSKSLQLHLKKFLFLVEWNSLSNNNKLLHYDNNMCNEINFYLYKQAEKFFNES